MKNDSHPGYSCKRGLALMVGCFITCSSISAQAITWSIVNAAGFDDGPDASLRWTIGEPLTAEVIGDDASLRVGFFPFAWVETGTTAYTVFQPEIEIRISPNPAGNTLLVQVPGEIQYQLRILSLNGVSELTSQFTTATNLDIRSLPSGPYVLYVIDPKGHFNSIPFIKS